MPTVPTRRPEFAPGPVPRPTMPAPRRPRWGRIFLIVLAVMGALGFLGLACGLEFAHSLNERLTRMKVFEGLGDRPEKLVDGAANILVIGSDGRAPGQDPGVEGERTDSIMIVHLDRDHEKAYVVSIPRDTYVFVPRSKDGNGGRQAKINAAHAWGGIPLVVKTVEMFTGVKIDHVVKVDFGGFKKMTDALGGVDVQVDQTVRDPRSGRVFHAGTNHLDGDAALDYVRQRYGLPNGDFDRVKRQQIFLRALLGKAVSTGTLTNPKKLKKFAEASADSMTVDEDFSITDFASQFRKTRQDDVVFLTMPTSGTATRNGQSVVLTDKERASQLFDAMARDELAEWAKAHPPNPATSGR